MYLDEFKYQLPDISLGILTQPSQLAVLMLAVLLLVAQGIVINRLAGLDYPLWAPRPSPETAGTGSPDWRAGPLISNLAGTGDTEVLLSSCVRRRGRVSSFPAGT